MLENARASQILDWMMEVAEKVPALEPFLDSAMAIFLRLIPCDHGAFYLFDHQGFVLKKAKFQGEEKPWKLPAALHQNLCKKGEQVLAEGNAMETGGFFLLPLYYQEMKEGKEKQEVLPLGIWLVEPQAMEKHNQEFVQEFLDFVAAYLSQHKYFEQLLERSEALDQEVTAVKKTEWEQNQKLKFKFYNESLVGGLAPTMTEVFEMLERIIPTLSSVMIEGESGTGKELVAQTIHYKGPLADKPFVTVNCGALHPELLESQIFGHIRGAFTGAVSDQVGFLAQAHGGTLFLDEISDLPIFTQAKLLRVLQEGEYHPLGSHEVRKANFRLIAASHTHLEDLVKQGLFRDDLFYRLNVITVRLPPLRERREDIPLLVTTFLKNNALRHGKAKKKVSRRAMRALCEAPWPGNIRQLHNTLEMVLTMHTGSVIQMRDLRLEMETKARTPKPLPLKKAKEHFIKQYLHRVMNQSGGQILEAARMSGINRESLYRLLRTFR